ncbi:sugar O-acetyltransferase [Flaviaesturariibacter flavus]|uniref:Sugar O-acetyltransferase n=1 Tax=Flaviaesturariibacter flavus TaxID=2502780 RepID=A0A4R1BNC3_9BACT|nr:sugar O-acetyltransferase [Flaviaesturariibacter flavus]TCJ18961.1 sugar O-acetyltransferase [Flaviaesturariibacter flavus]
MTEREKMLSGALNNAADEELTAERTRCRLLLHQLNGCPEDTPGLRLRVLHELLPHATPDLQIQPPFYCDYGTNIRIGKGVFINFNCVVLDVAPVSVGNRTLIGPNVQIYTATHPMEAHVRAQGLESGAPVTIGDDVWIGGSAVILPGVTIGDRSVIGAGSVVTRDVPADVFVAGNPARVIRKIGEGNVAATV